MTTRTAATASLSSFGTSTSSSSSCVFDHANRPTKAEARAVRPRAVSCEVVGPGWVDVCCLSNRVSSQFSLFIMSEENGRPPPCAPSQRLFATRRDTARRLGPTRRIHASGRPTRPLTNSGEKDFSTQARKTVTLPGVAGRRPPCGQWGGTTSTPARAKCAMTGSCTMVCAVSGLCPCRPCGLLVSHLYDDATP